MSKIVTYTNGLLTGISGSSLSIGIAPKKYTYINGILTKVEDAGGLSRTQSAMTFVNGLLASTGSFTSGSSTPPPPITEMWLAGGISTNDYLKYSYDGINWTGLGKSIWAFGLCYNGSIWVAAGGNNNDHNLAYSTDGMTWHLVSELNSWDCVTWNGTRFIAGGRGYSFTTGQTFADSLDGIHWNIQNVAKIGYVANIAWNGSMFVATGDEHYGFSASYHNNMVYSSDGLSWTGLGTTTFTTTSLGIATNGSIWVATGAGGNTIAYSYNGIDWTGLGSSIFTTSGGVVCWNGSLFVAAGIGTNRIAYSYNGIDWTGLGNPLSYDIDQNGAQCLNWDGTKFLIGSSNQAFPYGSANTLGYSYDGINWFGLGKSVYNIFYSIASNIAPAIIPPI
jgi:hypothetical protein